jgi:hypothetical protein
MRDAVIFFPKNTEENRVRVRASINKKIAEEYAPKRQKNANFYAAQRGGKPPSLFDSWYYKCAEFGAAVFLTDKHDLPLVKPDTKIYSSRNKDWTPDLSYFHADFLGNHHESLRFAVKSANAKTIKSGFRESFIFQVANKEGSGGKDAILTNGNKDDYCIFMHVPYTDIVKGDLDFYVRAIVPWLYIKENGLLENLKKPEFLGKKVCVYSETLENRLAVVA